MMSIPLDTVLLYDSVPVEKETVHSASALKTTPDAPLVALAMKGDADAFEVLVRRYRNEVFALSYHFVHNREEAWDISQEVFIKAYKSLRRFRGDASFKTWLMRITANHCKDFFKKRRLRTVSLEEQIRTDAPGTISDPARQLEQQELGRAIEMAVNALPEKHRLAFVLREYQGLSYQEMAEVMQCSLGTVMSRLHHARKKLQNALSHWEEHGGMEQ